MPVYVDVSAAVHGRAGLGRYAASLTRALVPLLGDQLALFYNREAGIDPVPGLEHLPERTVSLGYKPWRMLVWMGQLAQLGFDRASGDRSGDGGRARGEADRGHLGKSRPGFDRLVPGATLFHATEHLLPPLARVPTVLTVHDLVFRHFPEHHKPLNRWFLTGAMPLFCRRADHIVAVSEYTRRDIVAAYGVSPDRITVVHEAADGSFGPPTPGAVAAARRRFDLPDRYVLYVGTIEPRKNLSRLLAAFECARAADLVDGLVIVGRRGWLTDRFDADLAQSPARDAVRFPGFIPDADLPAIYGGALAFAFPSVFEGFGLPVIEAMACGAPVVCANTSSLPEVAGDAAVLVDPGDDGEIARALARVLSDPALRASMRARGLAQAARFSWERTARETAAVYERVARRAM